MKSTHLPEYKRLLEALATARLDAGLTQQELASRLGKPQSFVSKYEKGERRLDILEFVRIAETVGADYRAIIEAALAEGADGQSGSGK